MRATSCAKVQRGQAGQAPRPIQTDSMTRQDDHLPRKLCLDYSAWISRRPATATSPTSRHCSPRVSPTIHSSQSTWPAHVTLSWPSNASFATELEKFYIPRGVVDLVKDEGTIKGVALWVSPDAPIRRRDELRMFPGLVKALGRSLPRAMRIDFRDAAAVPGFPHWYLYTIVVSPRAQGQGIGGAPVGLWDCPRRRLSDLSRVNHARFAQTLRTQGILPALASFLHRVNPRKWACGAQEGSSPRAAKSRFLSRSRRCD